MISLHVKILNISTECYWIYNTLLKRKKSQTNAEWRMTKKKPSKNCLKNS